MSEWCDGDDVVVSDELVVSGGSTDGMVVSGGSSDDEELVDGMVVSWLMMLW